MNFLKVFHHLKLVYLQTITQQHNTIIAPPFRFNDKDSENDNFLPELVNRLKGLRKEMMAGDNRHSIGIINDGNEHK